MVDIEKIEKRTVQSFYDDGLFEIGLGFVFVLLGGFLFVQTALPKGSTLAAIIGFFLIGIIFLAAFLVNRVIRFLKRRITYPRTGFVAFKKQPVSPRKRLRAGLFGGFIGALFAVLLGLAPSLRTLLPALNGFMLALISFKIANRVGVARFFVLATLSAVIGFSLTAGGIGDSKGISLFYLIFGAAVVISGLAALVVYLRRNPRPAAETPEGPDAR
jgi:hypothetical protein